jgi:hypothetical protein
MPECIDDRPVVEDPVAGDELVDERGIRRR